MLFILSFVLFVAWVLGFGFFHVAGWFIHILIVLAVISLLIRLIRGK